MGRVLVLLLWEGRWSQGTGRGKARSWRVGEGKARSWRAGEGKARSWRAEGDRSFTTKSFISTMGTASLTARIYCWKASGQRSWEIPRGRLVLPEKLYSWPWVLSRSVGTASHVTVCSVNGAVGVGRFDLVSHFMYNMNNIREHYGQKRGWEEFRSL